MNSSKQNAGRTLARLKRARTPAKVVRLLLRESRKRLLFDLANLRPVHLQAGDPACAQFWKRWPYFPRERTEALLGLCDELRKVWRPDTTLTEKRTILQRWLGEMPKILAPQQGFAGLAEAEKPLLVTLRRDEPIIPASLRASLVWGVSSECSRFAYCANKDCPHPYFLRERRTQRYCSEDCAEPAQKKFKRDWWAEHGDKWRRKHKKRKAKKSRKRGG
jgi:hypothetical protein